MTGLARVLTVFDELKQGVTTMAKKDEIRAEFDQFAAAEKLAQAVLLVYGAIKLTEAKQPRMVVAAFAGLESALEGWSAACEVSSALVEDK
jgi:hypothetical protein